MLKEGKVTVEQAIQLLSVLDGSPHTHGPLNFIDVKSRFFYSKMYFILEERDGREK